LIGKKGSTAHKVYDFTVIFNTKEMLLLSGVVKDIIMFNNSLNNTMSINIIKEHIEITPGICGGKPRIAGHRI
jgi:hypothetical protein